MVSANHTTGNRPLSISPCYWNGPHMDRENLWPWWQLKFVHSYIVILVVSAIQQSGFLRPHFRYSHLRLWELFWTAEERRMLTSLASNCWRHEVSSVLVLQPVTICNRDFLIFRGTRTVCVLKDSLRPFIQRFLNLFVSLQLREIEWESSGFLLHDRRCDVACFIYDSTNASSFTEVVQLREVISASGRLYARVNDELLVPAK